MICIFSVLSALVMRTGQAWEIMQTVVLTIFGNNTLRLDRIASFCLIQFYPVRDESTLCYTKYQSICLIFKRPDHLTI